MCSLIQVPTPQDTEPREGAGLKELGLWLTEKEANLLVAMCAASRVEGGKEEHALFAKLGELVRAFSENEGPMSLGTRSAG